MRVYLAGPLFTLAERRFMGHVRDLVNALPGVDALWPGDLFDAEELAVMGAAAKAHIHRGCVAALESCSLVVAVIDGPQVDDGTAWEAGYAYAKGIAVWGMRTDFRMAGDTVHSVVNCMIECSCDRIIRDVDRLLVELAAFAGQADSK